MGPIRVPHSNSPVHSSAHAPHSVGIGVRAENGGSGGGGNNNNSSGSSISPPLVVVVVAIGLFSLTMFSMFGRRLLELGSRSPAAGNTLSRYPAAPTAVQDERRLFLTQALGLGHAGRAYRAPPAQLGTKPKLWDIQFNHNQIHATEPRDHALLSWDDIMPLAVTVSEEERCSVADRPAPHALTRRPTDRRVCRLFRWLYLSCRRRRPTQTGQAVRDQQPDVVDKKATVSLLPRKNLQVVVAIAMPCRPRQTVYPFDMESRRTCGVDVDYSIGLYTCSWDREGM